MNKDLLIVAILPCLMIYWSIAYFICLPTGLHMYPTVLWSVLVSPLFLGIYFITRKNIRPAFTRFPPFSQIALTSILLLATLCIADHAYHNTVRYGAWDAWWLWNYRAKFFTSGHSWNLRTMPTFGKDLVGNMIGHADYPPGSSALTAFFWKLSESYDMVYPYLVNMVFVLSVPLLLFLDMYRKNWFLATSILFFLFVNNHSYALFSGMMLPDIWIAFFFPASFIFFNRYLESDRFYMALLSGLMLGALLWSKNEGVVLVIVYLLTNARFLYKDRAALKAVFSGIAIPFFCLLIFKTGYAPPGDLFAGTWKERITKLSDIHRYELVWNYFKKEINTYHVPVKYITLFFLLYALYKKIIPGKELVAVFLIMLAYCLIYVISPHNPDWHLSTSIGRLIWHILPLFIYAIGRCYQTHPEPPTQK